MSAHATPISLWRGAGVAYTFEGAAGIEPAVVGVEVETGVETTSTFKVVVLVVVVFPQSCIPKFCQFELSPAPDFHALFQITDRHWFSILAI